MVNRAPPVWRAARPRPRRRGRWRPPSRSPARAPCRCRRRRPPGRRRARSARRPARSIPLGEPGPVVRDLEHRISVSPLDCDRGSRCPAGVWRSPFSSRLRARRWSSSGLPLTATGPSPRASQAVPVGNRATSETAAARDLGEVALAPGADPAGVGPGEQQQIGHQPAHPPRGARAPLATISPSSPPPLGPSRLALQQLEVGEDARQRRPQLVRRVGDEVALGLHYLVGLSPRRLELTKHLVEVRASSATSSSASGSGIRRDGSRVAGDLAGGRRELRDRAASSVRRARSRPRRRGRFRRAYPGRGTARGGRSSRRSGRLRRVLRRYDGVGCRAVLGTRTRGDGIAGRSRAPEPVRRAEVGGSGCLAVARRSRRA